MLKDSLVLYKSLAAHVLTGGDKLEIRTKDGTRKVRQKDVTLLHPGPLSGLGQLKPVDGDIQDAWELLQGETTTLEDLCELIYSEFTPSTAWSCWQVVEEGLYFRGQPDAIEVIGLDEVEAQKQAREAKAKEAEAWQGFLERVRSNAILAEDSDRMAGVEALARGRSRTAKLLKELGKTVSPESAHTLLLKLGFWQPWESPHADRFDIPKESAQGDLPQPDPTETRHDLTHLPAFAIDDENNKDPDDAISLDGEVFWVHVADVASMVPPDSEADLEARGRGANSYLPEKVTSMLPQIATDTLGLGLQEVSPALSFGMRFSPEGEILDDIQVVASQVKVTRLTYAEAEARMTEEPFASMGALMARFRERRSRIGSALLNLPEVKIKVVDNEIFIRPLVRHGSRDTVTDAMLAAGEAAAKFAQSNQIPIPYATQGPPDTQEKPTTISEMWAYRRKFKRTRMQTEPDLHAGLGLPIYTRATSPLRRYLDLVVHQQLRAFIAGTPVMDEEALLERVGAAEAVSGNVRQAERTTNRHWILEYLRRNPTWEGAAILVEKRRKRGIFLIPELGYETNLALEGDPEENTEVVLYEPSVDIPNLSAYFKIRWADASQAD